MQMIINDVFAVCSIVIQVRIEGFLVDAHQPNQFPNQKAIQHQKKTAKKKKHTHKMNDNLHGSRPTVADNYGPLDLEKMNPLGELNFFFGNSSTSSSGEAVDHINGNRQQQQQQQQQSGNKRSMDDVLKKLTSKMHINHTLPGDESDRSVLFRLSARYIHQIICVRRSFHPVA